MATGAARSALIVGATGATGSNVLRELLSSPNYTRVGEYGRSITSASNITTGKEKLEQKTIDFEKLDQAGLKDGRWDVVFITIGTSKAKAGSAAAFEKIDREYVINTARAAKSDDPQHQQRLIYVSSAGANPNSSFLYTKSKGLTEEGLASLGYSDTVIFRPGSLKDAQRTESRSAEVLLSPIMGLMQHFSPNYQISVPILAKSLRLAGELGSQALPAAVGHTTEGKEGAKFTVINNAGALALAKLDK